jgi:hypothetical protein
MPHVLTEGLGHTSLTDLELVGGRACAKRVTAV